MTCVMGVLFRLSFWHTICFQTVLLSKAFAATETWL
jgi:hypothetical protein